MERPGTIYAFARGDRGIFAEIYFPKKVEHQGTIFNALRDGYGENNVKIYLRRNVESLLEELRDYEELFDPYQYNGRTKTNKPRSSREEALTRIGMYRSPFKGWSIYSVDGVFFGEEDRLIEESTQVVRIMFRFESAYAEKAMAAGCSDVLRAIFFWTISSQGNLNEHVPWSKHEQARFMAHHQPWPKKKRAFSEKHFAAIAKEVKKWVDDCALFVFGYLVRQFAENVLRKKLHEEEIWVTSFFNLTVNVVKRVQQKGGGD